MEKWKRALREGWVAGSVASVASTAALLLAGRREARHAAAPVNAVSHWVWDREALRADAPSARHTVVGLLVHQGASVFWATLHARAWGMHERNKRAAPAVAGAAVTSALACFVDFRLTPRRLTPGFESRVSKRSLALVYACFALGLAAGSMVTRRREPARSTDAAQTRPPNPAS
jgi:hypothetical protein